MNRLLDGPHIIIRAVIVRDTWLSGATDRIDRLARVGGGVLLGREIDKELPYEARCRLCDVRPLEFGETEADYTAYLKEERAAVGPVSLAAAQRWTLWHLLSKHGIDGVSASYEVRSGAERWVA